jgi:hypothetical protein
MKFRVSYLVSGTRVVEVHIPDNVAMPEGWATMPNEQKDEWLFSMQTTSRVLMEDLDYAEAHKISEVP